MQIEQEQKRQQQLERKLENQKAHDEELDRLTVNAKSKQMEKPQKVTQAQIEREKQLEVNLKINY